MKFILIILIAIIILSLMAYSFKNQVSTIISDDAFLVDVRTPQEFATGSVPNSINIPLDVIADSIHKFSSHDNIIVFCRSGNRSGKAKKILESNGISNVTNGGSSKNVLAQTSIENY